jgi:hypothetical protein
LVFHLSTMNDGIVLQTHFGLPPNENPTVPPIPPTVSLPSLATKKNKPLHKYGPFGLVIVLLLVILIIVAVIVSKISSHSAIPIELTPTVTNKSSTGNLNICLFIFVNLKVVRWEQFHLIEQWIILQHN